MLNDSVCSHNCDHLETLSCIIFLFVIFISYLSFDLGWLVQKLFLGVLNDIRDNPGDCSIDAATGVEGSILLAGCLALLNLLRL